MKSGLSAWSQELSFMTLLEPTSIYRWRLRATGRSDVLGRMQRAGKWHENIDKTIAKHITETADPAKDAKSVTPTSILRETVSLISLSDGAADSTALFAASASSAIRVAIENLRTSWPEKRFFPFLSISFHFFPFLSSLVNSLTSESHVGIS